MESQAAMRIPMPARQSGEAARRQARPLPILQKQSYCLEKQADNGTSHIVSIEKQADCVCNIA